MFKRPRSLCWDIYFVALLDSYVGNSLSADKLSREAILRDVRNTQATTAPYLSRLSYRSWFATRALRHNVVRSCSLNRSRTYNRSYLRSHSPNHSVRVPDRRYWRLLWLLQQEQRPDGRRPSFKYLLDCGGGRSWRRKEHPGRDDETTFYKPISRRSCQLIHCIWSLSSESNGGPIGWKSGSVTETCWWLDFQSREPKRKHVQLPRWPATIPLPGRKKEGKWGKQRDWKVCRQSLRFIS